MVIERMIIYYTSQAKNPGNRNWARDQEEKKEEIKSSQKQEKIKSFINISADFLNKYIRTQFNQQQYQEILGCIKKPYFNL